MRILRLRRFKKVIYLKSYNKKLVESGIECLLWLQGVQSVGMGKWRVLMTLHSWRCSCWRSLWYSDLLSNKDMGERERRKKKENKTYIDGSSSYSAYLVMFDSKMMFGECWLIRCFCFVTCFCTFPTTWHPCSKKITAVQKMKIVSQASINSWGLSYLQESIITSMAFGNMP